jgi:hypothetical protein
MPTNVSTPRAVHVVKLSGLLPGARYSYKVRIPMGGKDTFTHTCARMTRTFFLHELSRTRTREIFH